LDPELIAAVDAHVARHPGLDRSAVFDEALRLWHEREQDAAMERQIREDEKYRDDPDRWPGGRSGTPPPLGPSRSVDE
jgi:Arc/MetJ-type ribon-helix-helix transcriptional regulator